MNGEFNMTGAPESGTGRWEVGLDFRGSSVDMFGWGVLGVLAFLPLAIPVAWYYRAFSRWFVSKTVTSNHLPVTFVGIPEAVWYLPPLAWIAGMISNWTEAPFASLLLALVQLVVSLWVYWRLLRWFMEGLRLNGVHAFRFNGELTGYAGWQLLLGLSFITIVGWAWVAVKFMHWIYRHSESPDMELEFHGRPTKLLQYGLLMLYLPAALILIATQVASWLVLLLMIAWIVALPWMVVQVTRWIMRETRLIMKTSEPALTAAPML